MAMLKDSNFLPFIVNCFRRATGTPVTTLDASKSSLLKGSIMTVCLGPSIGSRMSCHSPSNTHPLVRAFCQNHCRGLLITGIDLLEASTIAWPNAAMWRQVPVVTTYYAQVQSPQPTLGDADTHHHSPRRIQNASRHGSNLALSGGNPMPPPTIPAYIRQANHDPFVDSTSQAFNLWRQPSSDVSMPDYSKSNSRASSMRNITDTATMPDISGRQFASLQELGAYESVCEALSPAVPAAPSQRKGDGVSTPVMTVRKPSANTRPVGADIIQNIHPFQASTTFLEPVNAGQQDLPEKAERNRNSPSTMDATNIKSRKENVPKTLFEENPQAQDKGLRKVAQPFSASNITGTKRQRVITPAASKVIDHEDQPRVSPIARKLSRQDARDGRSVLGGIENI